MKTAVEWLFLMMNNPNKDQEFANKLFEKAKEIEKQQIIDAFHQDRDKLSHYEDGSAFDEYYNETFKTE